MSKRTPEPAATSTVSLSTPGDLVTAVPYLVGFTPRESVVAISLRRKRGRVGLVMRMDLPAERCYGDAAALLAAHLDRDGARHAAFVVYPPAHVPIEERPGARLVEAAERELAAHGIDVREALVVHGGRWASYLCTNDVCCPPAGAAVADPSASPVAAAAVANGKVVLDDRSDLARLLEHTDVEDKRAVAAAVERVPRGSGLVPRRRCDLDLLEDELSRHHAGMAAGDRMGGEPLRADRVAALGLGLRDLVVRDHAVAVCVYDEPETYEPLWLELTRRLPAPLDAGPAVLLAIAAYARGDGAFTRVCLEHAQSSDPGYSFADLLTEVLDGGTRPDDVLRVLRAAYDGLEITDKEV